MVSHTPPDEVQPPHVAHGETELRAAKPNGFTTPPSPDELSKPSVGVTKPRKKPKVPSKPMSAPKDCPIIKQQIPIIPPRNGAIASASWFWPLLFTILCGVLTIGIWAGRISTQDDGRSIVIGELKANDAALASRIESVATDRNRDTERLARLEVTVQSIDKNIQSLIDISRPKSLRRD